MRLPLAAVCPSGPCKNCSLIFPLSPLRLAFLAWGDFHARLRFARSTLPDEKWGLLWCSSRELTSVRLACMTRSLPQLLVGGVSQLISALLLMLPAKIESVFTPY